VGQKHASLPELIQLHQTRLRKLIDLVGLPKTVTAAVESAGACW
jgi:hypothetical protein